MRCADCILECAGRSPLGGCPNGEYAAYGHPDCVMYQDGMCQGLPGLKCSGGPCSCYRQEVHTPIFIPPETGFIGKDKVPDTKELDAVRQRVFEEMRSVSLDLVDAVERYVEPKPGDTYCSRNEVLMAKSKLKKLLNDEK